MSLEDGGYIHGLFRHDPTYSWATIYGNLKKFEKLGLITREKSGRKKFIMLTSKGKKVKDYLLNIENILR